MGTLTSTAVRNAKPGRHTDGDGLMLLVKPSGARSWVLRIQVDGRRRDIGLGSVDISTGQRGIAEDIPLNERRVLTLSEARLKAGQLRQLAKAGRDPVAELRRDRSPTPTFRDAAQRAHDARLPEWAGKTASAFLSSLKQHAHGPLGDILVSDIDARLIADALLPIWVSKPQIARKVRQRIGLVLNYAEARRWRSEGMPNAALSLLLPRQPESGNFAAMPYKEVPAFVRSISDDSGSMGRLALTFLILTGARSGEVRGAKWSQIDRTEKLWVRPPELMKGRNARQHAVTLSEQALAVLDKAADYRRNDVDLIFPGRRGKMLSDMSLAVFMEGSPYTPHGFRSSFRDYSAEKCPDIPDPVAEAALAHKVSDKVVAAYKRTDFLEMRRDLMSRWGAFVSNADSNVVRLATDA